MTTKRKPISKSVRFEVFKRDSFTCQYCGKSAPEVILHIDHINPVAKGGGNEVINLLTSCEDCNSGKGARTLDDKSVIQKQRQQLAELNERREQLEMMLRWKEGLQSIEEDQINAIQKILCEGQAFSLSEHGRGLVRKALKRFSFEQVYEAARTARAQYAVLKDGVITDDSFSKMMDYIPRICGAQSRDAEDPDLKRLYYIRGIARNRFSYCNDWQCMKLLKEARDFGVPVEDLQEIAKFAKNWTQFCGLINEAIDSLGE